MFFKAYPILSQRSLRSQRWKIFINGEFELWYVRDREKREVRRSGYT